MSINYIGNLASAFIRHNGYDKKNEKKVVRNALKVRNISYLCKERSLSSEERERFVVWLLKCGMALSDKDRR